MEKWSLRISIIALIISLLEMYHNQILNKTNLKSEYFKEIYSNYLFNKIPGDRKGIDIINGRFVGFRKLQDTLTDMVSDLSFFKFADGRFYLIIKKECMDLEDYLLNTANKKNISISSNPFSEIDIRLKRIYKIINRKREKGGVCLFVWMWWKIKNPHST